MKQQTYEETVTFADNGAGLAADAGTGVAR